MRAVCDRGADVDSVLVITYTRRAAGELRAPDPRSAARARAARPRPRARRRLDLDDPRLLPPAAEGVPVRGRASTRASASSTSRRRRCSAARRSTRRSRCSAPARSRSGCGCSRPTAPAGCAGCSRASTRRCARRAARSCSSSASGPRSPSASRSCARRRAASPTTARRRSPARERGPRARARRRRAARRSAARPLRPPRARRARGDLRGGAAAPSSRRRSTSSPPTTATCSRLLLEFAAAYARAKERESALDFEDLQLDARDLLRDHARDPRARGVALPRDHGRRVPGHEPPPVRARSTCSRTRPASGRCSSSATSSSRSTASATPTSASSASGARQAGGGLALTRNYRSRPEVLAGGQPALPAGVRRRLPAAGGVRRVPGPRLRPPGRAARHRQDGVRRPRDALAPRRGAAHRAAGARARRRGPRDAGRDRAAVRGRDGRRVVRGGAARRRPADLPGARTRLLRPAAGRRPARVPAAAAEPLRRRGARHRARLAVRRRLERRARAAAPRRRPAAALHRARARAAARARRPGRSGCCARSGSATNGSRRPPPASRSSGSARRSSPTHDYDLAVLARSDGRRRYANLRKLARLARSYEELRGRDIEGFVRFVREQEAVGAKELEAVAEEEGADAVRLLTIHAAKGLEFKVVVVADAGRDRAAPDPDEILALSDGRFGFRVAHPFTSERKPAFDYDEVRERGSEDERAERLRLYYVAMTRAIDRLIVSGSIDRERRADASTPIGWVLARLDADEELRRGGRAGRARARRRPLPPPCRPRRPRSRAAPSPRPRRGRGAARAVRARSRRRRRRGADARTARARSGAAAARACARSRSRRSRSSSAARTATTPSASSGCAHATRPVVRGSRGASRRPRSATPSTALLEALDLAAPRGAGPRGRALVVSGGRRRGARADPRASSRRYCESELAARVALLPGVQRERQFAFEHDGVLLHGFLDVFHLGGRARARRRLQDEHARRGDAGGDRRGRLPAAAARLRARLPARRRRGGRGRVRVPRAARRGRLGGVRARRRRRRSRRSSSAAIARIHAGDFRPTPSEFTCAGCPALDLVCAGPRLPGAGPVRPPALAAAG